MIPIHRLRLAGTPDGFTIAFIYDDQGIHLGLSHSVLVNELGQNWEDLYNNPPVFGWVEKRDGVFRAEIFSGVYQDNQSEDTKKVDEALVALRKRYPITELVYGPGSATITDLSEHFDDPRLAALDYIHQSVL